MSLTNECFFIQPPDPMWLQIAIAEGRILLGDIVFHLEAFDLVKYDGGWELFTCWVKMVYLLLYFMSLSLID